LKTSQNFLSLGILVIIAGIILLVMSSSSEIGTSMFFFFPFFFVSTNDVLVVFLLMALTFFIFVIMMRLAVAYFSQVESRFNEELTEQYIPVGTKCSYCYKPLPADAVYCSSCGSPVSNDRTENQ
jgi:hypothetical protein